MTFPEAGLLAPSLAPRRCAGGRDLARLVALANRRGMRLRAPPSLRGAMRRLGALRWVRGASPPAALLGDPERARMAIALFAGPRPEASLGASAGVPEHLLRRHLALLARAGLVAPLGGRAGWWALTLAGNEALAEAGLLEDAERARATADPAGPGGSPEDVALPGPAHEPSTAPVGQRARAA